MDAATHALRVPFQRRHALAGRHVPHLERLVVRRRHDAPPVRKHGNAIDLRRSQIITKVQRTPQRTESECPSSVATHSPVATSHTLSVWSRDPETTRRPSANTATPWALSECPSNVARHSPVSMSHTLSVLSHDADTTRRPSGNTATQKTYDEDTSQKYQKGHAATPPSSALAASAARRASMDRVRRTA